MSNAGAVRFYHKHYDQAGNLTQDRWRGMSLDCLTLTFNRIELGVPALLLHQKEDEDLRRTLQKDVREE